ncbi:leucine-rich repeat domain-containing protein [Mesorhizobium hawassense]|nr:leucine-rich repeat domain-containing protein [Mesorhizobium hawassense]
MRLRLVLLLALALIGWPRPSLADAPNLVLVEDSGGGTRLNFPLLISNGRGYRIRCAAQTDEEKIIQGLGFVLAPSDVLSAVDPAVAAAKPLDNPLLCPTAPNYPIKIFTVSEPAGQAFYMQFPTDFGSASYGNRIYRPSCVGLIDALQIDLTKAINADPRPFFGSDIYDIQCLRGAPLQSHPDSFAAWCSKSDLGDEQRKTVLALLQSTPGGTTALGDPPKCTAAQSYLTTITSLDLSGFDLTNLEPLEVLPNLTSLSLSRNRIADPASLAKLVGLTFLDLSGNQIENLSALAPLIVLTSLDLGHNAISNLRPLSSNRALTQLNLGSNQITDVTPLHFLQKLTELNLANNQLNTASVAPLTSLGALTRLDLTNNKIEILDSFGQFPDATEIKLAGNPVMGAASLGFTEVCVLHRGDASPFGFTIRAMLTLAGNQNCEGAGAALNSMTTLDLSNKQISDVRPIAMIKNLTALNLSTNAIVDIAPLADIAGLSTLNLATNNIVNARPLAELPSLTTLDLSSNPVDVSGFLPACLVRGQASLLNDTQKAEIAALLSLTGQDKCRRAADRLASMTAITLVNAGLKTLDYFSILQNVQRLDLHQNALADATKLTNLPHLSDLNLAQNQMASLASLTNLRGLESLVLDNNPLGSLNGIQSLARLRNLQISNTSVSNIGLLGSLPLLERAQLRNLPIAYGGLEDYCLVHKLDPAALGEVGQFMQALEPRLSAAAVNSADCDAVGAWARTVDTLSLNQLNLTSIEPLRYFTNLSELYLSQNRIRDTEPLRGLLRLTVLGLDGNELQEAPWLRSDVIKMLGLAQNAIVSVAGLQSRTSLTWLNLMNNRVQDSRPLGGLTSLGYLDLRFNQIATGETVGNIYPMKPYLKGNSVCSLPVILISPPPPIVEACRREPIHLDPAVIGVITNGHVFRERTFSGGVNHIVQPP